jgi:hypothetical protein
MAYGAEIWGPALISLISGRLGAGAEVGRMKQLRDMLDRLYRPENVGVEANKFFDIFKSSPMYGGLRSGAMTGATQLGNQLRTSFARRGLSSSGIAGVAEPLARSSYQQTFADIDAGGYRDALQAALSSIGARAGIAERSFAPSVGAGTVSGGIQSYLPYLYRMLQQRGQSGSLGTTMGQSGFQYPVGR